MPDSIAPDDDLVVFNFGLGPNKPLAFARQGACEGRSAVTSTPQAIVKGLHLIARHAGVIA